MAKRLKSSRTTKLEEVEGTREEGGGFRVMGFDYGRTTISRGEEERKGRPRGV